MREPTEAEIAKYTPRYNFTRELNFGDHWRALWVEEDELPEGAPVTYAYALVMKGERGYVTRKGDTDQWRAVEIEMEQGDDPEAIVTAECLRQTGATVDKLILPGFFELKATRHNPDHEIGTIRVRALYVAVAKEVDDVPDDSPHRRRRMPINELSKTLKEQYNELDHIWRRALDVYLVRLAKGEL